MQAYNLSKDHKPDLEIEKERIYKAGGYIQCGRVNGTLNLSRAIGTLCGFNYNTKGFIFRTWIINSILTIP